MSEILVTSTSSRNGLDNDYTLYEDGTVLREYDRHIYPGGSNLREILIAKDLKLEVKNRLLEAASNENKDIVRKLLEG